MCCSGRIWPGGKNCSCVWLFCCSVFCSAGQRATVQRESELGVRGKLNMNRKTKYGQERKENTRRRETGLTLTPPSWKARSAPCNIQQGGREGGGGGCSGGLQGQGDGTECLQDSACSRTHGGTGSSGSRDLTQPWQIWRFGWSWRSRELDPWRI